MSIESSELLEKTNTEMRKLTRLIEAIHRENAISHSNNFDANRFKEHFTNLYAMMGSFGRLKLGDNNT